MFKNKTILYVHGFGSSGQSGTVTRLREAFPEATVVAPDLPLHPEEAMALLRKTCEDICPDIILGTSMGGMYTEMLYGYDRILVNPAFEMGDTMVSHNMVGAQKFQNPRKDGVQDFLVTKGLVKEYKDITAQCFSSITEEEKQRVWGMFGDEDPVVHTQPLFCKHYTQAVSFHGEHRMDDNSFFHAIIPVMRWIDDRQEGRTRSSVYVTLDALRNERMQPKASMLKGVRSLLPYYDVFFVVDAPAYSSSSHSEAEEWLNKYINVPAYNHIIYTSHPELLYGDYLIDTEERLNSIACRSSEFMSTTIVLHSSDFKTWEEIVVFFDRLGGQ